MDTQFTEYSLKSEEKTWGMLAHIAALAGYVIPFGNIFGPLIIWMLKKEESPFVDFHGKESINFQITMTIYVVVALILMLLVVGVVLLIAVFLFDLAMIIVAAIKAANGEQFRYPLSIRFIH
jgi:uncharacterized Tic20 family protein